MKLAYQEDQKPLGIPYMRLPEDQTSHSYIDLKKEPSRIDEIPELRNEPHLRRVVERLNKQDGLFRSIGCARCTDESDALDGIVHFASYVGFAIDAWPFQRKDAARSIFTSLSEFGARLSWPDEVTMILSLVRTKFYDRGEVGWSLDFWCRGSAATREEAHAAWGEAMDRFAEFLDFEHSRWRDFLEEYPLAEMVPEGE